MSLFLKALRRLWGC